MTKHLVQRKIHYLYNRPQWPYITHPITSLPHHSPHSLCASSTSPLALLRRTMNSAASGPLHLLPSCAVLCPQAATGLTLSPLPGLGSASIFSVRLPLPNPFPTPHPPSLHCLSQQHFSWSDIQNIILIFYSLSLPTNRQTIWEQRFLCFYPLQYL